MKHVRCIVCGGTSEVVLWRENGYEGRSCRCGTVYTTPEPPEGAVDFTYDAHPESFYALYAPLRARWVRGCGRTGRLLEVGCGEGHFLAAAKALGYEIGGIEPEPGRAARASQRLGIEIRRSLLEELDWPEARFDVVYHCDLLSHFPDPIRALRKMAGLLAPNGILAFEVGTLGGIRPFWYGWIEQLGYPQHRWFYSGASLEALLRRAGLRIVRLRHFGLAPCVAFYRCRVLLARLLRVLVTRSPSAGVSTALAPDLGRTVSGGETFRGQLEEWFGRADQFFRYRVGALAPRLGPATLLVAARPEST